MSTRSGRTPRLKQVSDTDSNSSESPKRVTKSSSSTNARKDKSPKGIALEEESPNKDGSPARTTRRTSTAKDASSVQTSASPRSPARAKGAKTGSAESLGEPVVAKTKPGPKVSEAKEKKSEGGATGGTQEMMKEGTSAPSTPVAGIRRSGRAPVPSSKYKDMEVEIGSSRKRSSITVAASEGSDAEPEPAKKRNRKTSERSQYSATETHENKKAIQGEGSEEQAESHSAAETSEDENVPLSIEEMIQSNLSEAGLEKQEESKEDTTHMEEVPAPSAEPGQPDTVVEISTSKQTEAVEVSKVVASEETITSSPSVSTESEQLTLPSKNSETVTLVSLLPSSEKDKPSQEESAVETRTEEQMPSVSVVMTQPKGTEKPRTVSTSFSDFVTVSPTVHGHVMNKSKSLVEAPFATVMAQDGATYLNLSVEATTISTILKGKHLSAPQKPANRVQGHGRVLRNPSGNMIVKTSLAPPSSAPQQKEVPETKPTAPYSLLFPKNQQQTVDFSTQKGFALPGSIKSQTSVPQRVVVVRPADQKTSPTSTLIGVAQAASKALGEAKLGESTPTVIRFSQDLPSKRSTPTVVHVQTSTPGPVAAVEGKQHTPAAPKTASEILIQRLREQQKRVIIKESIHTADEMVRGSQLRQAESHVISAQKSANDLEDIAQQTNGAEAVQSNTVSLETSGETNAMPTETPRKQKISVLPGVLPKEVVMETGNVNTIQNVTHNTDEADQSQPKDLEGITIQSSQTSASEDGPVAQDSSQTEQQGGNAADSDLVRMSVKEPSETSKSESLTELTNVELTGIKSSPSEENTEGTPTEAGNVSLDQTISKYAASLQAAASAKDKEKVVEKIRIVDNGIEYDVSIVSEEEVAEEIIDNSATQLGQGEGKEPNVAEVEPEIIIKQEMDDDVGDIKPDIGKQTSGTQTVYSPRLTTVTEAQGMTSSVTHKLATVMEDGQEKKHVYYVSVIPNKGIMAKTRTTMTQASWVMGENGMFCCEKCDYETDRKANFYKHRRSHSGFKPHVCSVCHYKAGTSSNLKRHMGIHKDIREHKCTICGLCFRQKIHLERHIKYKHEEKSIKCPMCDYICANEQPDLKMHIKRKHSNENAGEILTCPECKVRVGNRKDLKQHMKFHKEGPELKLFCKECSFVTDCQSRLKRHTAIHSKQKPFQCGVCNYRAAQKEHVLRHLRTQHKIEIKKDRKRPWRRHKKVDTDDSLKERADFSSGDKIFACNHCTMRFAKLINLYKHLHTQHSDIMPPETDGNFYCVVCEYSTTNKKNLLVHMRRHNMADQTPPTHVYSCVLCRYVNPKRRNLFQHMRKKHNINISKQTESYLEGEDDTEGQEMEVSEVISSVNKVLAPNNNNNTSLATVTLSDTSETSKDATGELAGVANMIKIEDLTRTSGSGDADDIQALVIDSSKGNVTETAIHTTAHSADALEGLQALAEQAGLIDNIIEEQVPVMDEQQTVVIEQGGTSTEVVGNVEVVEGQLQQIIQAAEAPATSSGGEAVEGVELTEEQLSSLRTGDMVEMEGELYIVELTQDPNNPNKQLLSFLPVTQVQMSQESQSQ